MKTNKTIWLVIVLLACLNVFSQTNNSNKETITSLFVNPNLGKDDAEGTKEKPLKSLPEAAKRVNKMVGSGSIVLCLSAGTYGLSETASFNPVEWEFSKKDRLIIRAEILPDSTIWNPSKMPIIVSTMPFTLETNEKKEVTGGSNYGILIETSHVTIQGLRILGEPVHEKPSEGVLVRNYPIVWDGKNLSDLRITQCLFLGNKFALPNHLGILASGKELEVDHCVFYGVKDAVVMWNTLADQCTMHHNLILNSYGAVVWTWSTMEDFKFYNNVISGANVLWVLEKEAKNAYTIQNSMLVGYNQLVNKGGGPQDFGIPADPKKLKYNSDFKIKKVGSLSVEEEQTSRYYLQLKPGTLGTSYGSGLFYKVN
ncbi:hypothetical protein [Flavobacterium sp. 123]|jgi:hypothetical protein|uniref:hypothetical protein n=1 Tax=Flavobacterium sp. 123 TaxID=2135627 RepID=UPI000EB5B368|nr:hypothetical protein [Flavobacterium sp. 123]RKS99489.1 hypothetical protein C8C88_1274 [Flavobacterium sp. 123]